MALFLSFIFDRSIFVLLFPRHAFWASLYLIIRIPVLVAFDPLQDVYLLAYHHTYQIYLISGVRI